jgi:hypothetical protein
MDVEPLASGHGCRIGGIGPMLVMVFDSEPELALLDMLDKTQTEFVARHGKITGITAITMERLQAPSAEFRQRSADLSAKNNKNIACSAIVVQSKGLAAVIVRTFLAGYSLLVRSQNPQQSFKDVPAAVAWLQAHPAQLPAVKQLEGLAEAVERFVRQKPAA